MSESKHTPGPWYVSTEEGGPYRISQQPTGGTFWIAEAYAGVIGNEEEANARLIAAAPDLLEACEVMLELEDSISVSIEPDDVRAMLRAAIAKAKGEQP